MEWLLPAGVCLLLLVVSAVTVSLYALHRSIDALIEVRALKNSTHQVQFVPVEDELGGSEGDLRKAMDKEEAEAWDNLSSVSEPLS